MNHPKPPNRKQYHQISITGDRPINGQCPDWTHHKWTRLTQDALDKCLAIMKRPDPSSKKLLPPDLAYPSH
jgi:hypothetical protein